MILTNLKTVKYHRYRSFIWRNIVAFYFKYFQTSIFSKERSNKYCCLSQKQAQLPIIIRCGLLFTLQIFFTIIDCSFWVLLTEGGPSSRSIGLTDWKDLQPTFSNRFFLTAAGILSSFILYSGYLDENFSVCCPMHHNPLITGQLSHDGGHPAPRLPTTQQKLGPLYLPPRSTRIKLGLPGQLL